MNNFDIKLRRNFQEGQTISKFEAVISQVDKEDVEVDANIFPKYIRIPEEGFPYVVLKSTCAAAGNHTIFISDSWTKVSGATSYKSASMCQHLCFRVANDRSQRLAFIGFVLAVVGGLVDTGVLIGKVKVFWLVSEKMMIMVLIAGLCLKVAGFWLVFRKGLSDAK